MEVNSQDRHRKQIIVTPVALPTWSQRIHLNQSNARSCTTPTEWYIGVREDVRMLQGRGLQTTARGPNPAREAILKIMKTTVFTKTLLIC